MNKCSQELLSLVDNCLHQFAQTESDELSSIITSDDLDAFQASYSGCRVRDFPPIKTLTLFMRQVASDTKSSRHALIDEARDQVVKGSKDGLFKLKRAVRPEWMSQDFSDQMPRELVIRAVKNKRRTIITTLLNAEEHPRTEIIALYLKRWHVETDFNIIKTTMKIDILRCKSSEMVRKEISINFLVYNLIRVLMGQTARYIGKEPREVSFKAAQDTLVSFLQVLLGATGWKIKSSICWKS